MKKTFWTLAFLFFHFLVFSKGIVSLFPSAAEIVCDYGCGDRLVAVSDFAIIPKGLKAERIGGYYNLNFEKLISLNPDIIFAEKSHKKVLKKFPYLYEKTVFLSFLTLKDTFDSYRTIGEKLGISEKEINFKIESLKKRLSDFGKRNKCKGKKILIILGGGGEKIYACSDNYFTEVFENAGFENVLDGFLVKYPQLSYESFYSLNPDIIVILSSEKRGDFSLCSDGRLKMLEACKKGNVFVLSGEKILHAGSGLADLLNTAGKKMKKCFR